MVRDRQTDNRHRHRLSFNQEAVSEDGTRTQPHRVSRTRRFRVGGHRRISKRQSRGPTD